MIDKIWNLIIIPTVVYFVSSSANADNERIMVLEQVFPEAQCFGTQSACDHSKNSWKIKSLYIFNKNKKSKESFCNFNEVNTQSQEGSQFLPLLMDAWHLPGVASPTQIETAWLQDGSCIQKYIPRITSKTDYFTLSDNLGSIYNLSEAVTPFREGALMRKKDISSEIVQKFHVNPVIDCKWASDKLQYFSTVSICFNSDEKPITCPRSLRSSCEGNSYRLTSNTSASHALLRKQIKESNYILVMSQPKKCHTSRECYPKDLSWKLNKLSLFDPLSGAELHNCGGNQVLGTLDKQLLETLVQADKLSVEAVNSMKESWERGGQCLINHVPGLINLKDYLMLGLDLMRSYSMSDISFESNRLRMKLVYKKIREKLDVQPRINCIIDNNGKAHLYEIKLCFNLQRKLLNCPRTIVSNCSTTDPIELTGYKISLSDTDIQKPNHKSKVDVVVLNIAFTEAMCRYKYSSFWCENPSQSVIYGFRYIPRGSSSPKTNCKDTKADVTYKFTKRSHDNIVLPLINQWDKYGTCLNELVPMESESDYLVEATKLYHRHLKSFEQIFYTNDGFQLSALWQLLKSKLYVSPAIRCEEVKKRLLLTHLDLCFDKVLNLIDCPSNVKSKCSVRFENELVYVK